VESLYPTGDFLEKIGNAVAEVEDYIDGARQAQQMTIDDFLMPTVSEEEVKELGGF